MSYKRVLLISVIFLLCGFVVFVTLKKPSNDKNWDDASKTLPEITKKDNLIHIHNIRNFSYSGKDHISSIAYFDEDFDAGKIKNVYFLVNPFSENSLFAHTFFSFVFTDGKSVSVSVEARKEKGEEYSSIKGLLRHYELMILWGSEKDFFSRRSVYFGEDLYRYRLDISTTTAQSLLTHLADETILLSQTPRFYNTVFENCTNVLADVANKVHPGSIPWNIARVFTGKADEFLYKKGLLFIGTGSYKDFEEWREDHNISPSVRKTLNQNPTLTPYGFSKIID